MRVLGSLFFLLALPSTLWAAVWTIAIDPGHGGKDPGAIGRNLGIYEKRVTLSIARELKAILDKDPNFRGVLTRNGDYYISVPERSEIARRHKANFLISIHADSSESATLRGASVWVLSNRRADSEMGQWLEDDEKRSELLGGVGKVLSSTNDKYLDKTVLDLQFGHSQRTGYELGRQILRRFANITSLSRSTPQHASLGVLRSPDIPSVLVETGFLSNAEEEAKLNTVQYRRRVAYMIYEGLVAFRNGNLNSIVVMPEIAAADNGKYSGKNADTKKNAAQTDRTLPAEPIRYKVKSGDSLGGLAARYQVKESEILTLNKLKKRRNLLIGETLLLPPNAKTATQKAAESKTAEKTADKKNAAQTDRTLLSDPIRYKVKSGDSLGGLAARYQVKESEILTLNNIKKRRNLLIGETLLLPLNAKTATQKAAESKTAEKTADQKNAASSDKKTQYGKIQSDKNKVPPFHTVKRDQTLYAVSREYNIPVSELLKLNPKLKSGKIQVGQKIKLREN